MLLGRKVMTNLDSILKSGPEPLQRGVQVVGADEAGGLHSALGSSPRPLPPGEEGRKQQ